MAEGRIELSSMSWHNGTFNGTSTPLEILNVVHFHYSWILSTVFLGAFVANSILSAEPSVEPQEPVLLGPGGKPLPRSARKAKEERDRRMKLQEFSPGRRVLFLYLASALLVTFIASGVNVIIHALTKAENGWWCGKETAVSDHGYRSIEC